jgi:hypothetical protein
LRRFAFTFAVILLAGVALLGMMAASRGRDSPRTLVEGVTDDPAVAKILARSCQDCHSDRTRWPWYSRIPPASWMLNNDVAAARSHMDFSRWSKYSLDDKRQTLTEVAAELRTNQMPPGRYLLMHPDARLSADEIALISKWTRNERHKLRAQADRDPNASH